MNPAAILRPGTNQVTKIVSVAQLRLAYQRGQHAKAAGWSREMPYDCAPKDHYWLRGYDGLPMEPKPPVLIERDAPIAEILGK